MRVVFIGAGNWTVLTAKLLVERDHEVVIVEADRAVIDELSDELDCSFLNGDGGNPEILREADPKGTDILFCLTENDQVNIIASLVGRSLGFQRVVTSIENPGYEEICQELGLEDTIVPAQTISRYLADMLAGIDYVELRTVVKEEARLFSFHATSDDAGDVSKLDLPSDARVVWFYRNGQFQLADDNTHIQKDDEVVIATHSANLETLQERWRPNGS